MDGEGARFRMPGDSHRTVVIGRTGTGKSVLGLHILSHSSIDKRPWLIIDHKGERMFDQIDMRAIRELKPGAAVPREPGLYYTNPRPRVDDRAIEDMLWQIWAKERTGIYIDEGLRINNAALETIMTQGRSLQIPVILCTQRPFGVQQEVFTQASYFAIFPLRRRDDQLAVENLINMPKFFTRPPPAYIEERHRCLWCDVENDENMILQAAPEPAQIIDRLNLRAPRRFWW